MLLNPWLAGWVHRSIIILKGIRCRPNARVRSKDLRSQTELLERRCLLTTIDFANPGSASVTILGAEQFDNSGWAVSDSGDVNGDGFDDFIISALNADGFNPTSVDAGRVYLVFGGPSLPSTIDLAALGAAGSTIYGIDTGDNTGFDLSGAGDVNGDGFDDIMIGVPPSFANPDGALEPGKCFVVFGASALPADIDLANPGTAMMVILGVDGGDRAGAAVSAAGDVNGDGFDDLLVGARGGDGPQDNLQTVGEAYVIFGSLSLPATLDLADLGETGVTIFGIDLYDNLGESVSGAGDINGDGLDDILIGASNAHDQSGEMSYAGETYVVFGRYEWPETINLASLGSGGITILGDAVTDFWGDASGDEVSAAGDINGDGYGDLLIGAPLFDATAPYVYHTGRSYVVFGGASLPSIIDLAALGTAGIKITGVDAYDVLGIELSGAGDVNADGYDDIIIATNSDGPNNTRLNANESYLIYGGPALPATINVATLSTAGITYYGAEEYDKARTVSAAGDVNGDGFADLLIGAYGGDAAGNAKSFAGETYVVFGGNFTSSVTHLGTTADETLAGTSGANIMNGSAGNDTVIGNGGADVIYGASGDDILAISDLNFRRLDGGNGSDTVRLDGSGLNLDLTAVADNRLINIEAIDIRGSGANSLTLNFAEIVRMTANSNPAHTTNTVAVRRNLDDTVTFGSGWTQQSSLIADGVNYQVFSQGAATLLLEKVDTVAPSVTLSSTTSAATNTSPIPVTVNFSEDVTGFSLSGIQVSNGSKGSFVAVNGSTYTFTVTPTGQDTVTMSVPGGVAVDAALNSNTASAPLVRVFDNQAPTLAITPNGTVTNAVSIQFTFQFNEVVTGFNASDIALVNGTSGPFTAVDGDTYTLMVTPAADASVGVNVAANVAQDNAGNGNISASASVTSDRTAPALTITPNGTATSASSITFTFQFNEAVSGFTAGDISITNGTAGTFSPVDADTYTLQVTPSSAGLVSVNVAANAAQDGVGNGNVTASASVTSDTLAPGLVITPNGGITNANPILFTFQFTELVTGFTGGDVVLTNGTAGTFTAVDGDTYTLQVTPNSNGTVSVSVGANAAQDFATNGNTAASAALTYDGVRPSLSINPSGSLSNSATITFTFQFSETVTGFLAGDISLTNASGGLFTAVDGDTYTLQVTPTADGTVTVSVGANAAQDVAANGNLAASVSVTSDRTAPSLTISPNATTSNANPIVFTFQFTEPVTGFAVGDVALLNGTAGTFTAVDGDTYTLQVTPTADGSVTVSVAANTAQDAATNGNNSASASVTSDRTPPTVTITPNSLTTDASPVLFTFQFSEPVSGFAVTDISLTNGSAGTFTAVDGDTYTLQVTPLADGSIGVSVAANAAQDAAANGNVSASVTVTSDRTSPGLSIIPNGVSTNASPFTFTFQFTEAVTGFIASDVVISNGTSGTFVAVDAETYTLQVIPNSDGAVGVSVGANLAQDVATNGNLAASASVMSDRTPPGLSITPSGTLTNANPILFTFQFTESISGFSVGDINVTNGSAGTFTAVDGDTYTLQVVPASNGTVSVNVAANVAQDAATNGNTSASAAVTSDRGLPTASVTAVSPNPRTTAVDSLIVTFNEPVTGLELSDLSLTRDGGANLLGGSQTLLTSDNITYTLSNLSGLTGLAGSYVLRLVANGSGIQDAAGNAMLADAAEAWARVMPTVTLSVNNNSIVEAGGTATITATLSAPSDVDVTVTLGFTGTAAFPADYSRSATQIVIPAGSLANSVLLAAVSDGDLETTELIVVDITGVTNGVESGSQQVATQIQDDDHSPVFTSSAAVSVPENSIVALTVTATDADVPAQTITYSISGGPDQSRFTITGAGVLKFITAPNFEAPADTGFNNVYNVQVRANDGHGGLVLQNVAITVTDLDESAPAVSLNPVSPDPRNSPVDSITIVFSEAVNGFDLSDLSLTRGGGSANLLTGSMSLATQDNITYTLGGLSGVTSQGGIYLLTVTADSSGIVDTTGNSLASGASDGWTTDAMLPTATITEVSPNPRQAAVSELTIVFSEAVNEFDLSDLSLTRDGGPNLLTGSESLTSIDNVTFTLGNVLGLTSAVGEYTLTLHSSASGIHDGVGNLMAADAVGSWSRVSPTVSLSINNSTLSEAAGTATVTATLSAAADVNVTVMLGFSGSATFPGDYSRSATQIVILAGNTAGSITLTGIQDSQFEGPESILVDLESVTNGVEDGTQQVTTQIIDDDHAPAFVTTATPSIPENSTSVLSILATDADVPAQTVTYTITGGIDRDLFSVAATGELRFQSPPNFEVPTDSDFNNTYEVQVTADDGHGGTTVQNLTVTVTNVAEAPTLVLGGTDVTWIRKQPPVTILPQITVGGASNLAGGTLTINVNAIGTPKKLMDVFHIPSFASLGTSSGPQIANGHLMLEVLLSENATTGAVQSFLRGLTFMTKGKGLKVLTRTMAVTLADHTGATGTASQTINVRKH